MLTRVDFRLTNLRQSAGPKRFEGYTIFSTPTPYIAMPDSTVAWWTTSGPTGPHGQQRLFEGSQSLIIRDVTYKRSGPPEPK